jgi:hypothetical protein
MDMPVSGFFAEDTLHHEMQAKDMSDEELRFLLQVRRYAANLGHSDRKLLLAMVRKFAATA